LVGLFQWDRARGGEVEVGQNSMIEIKFGARPPADRSRVQAE
jgi:hypothetical protein